MVEVLLVWAIWGISATALGSVVCNWAKRKFLVEAGASVWMWFWVGQVMMSILAGIITFFTPLYPTTKAFWWLVVGIFLFLNRNSVRPILSAILFKIRGLNSLALATGIFTMANAILKASGKPEIFDEGAYHLPLIRMWETQGLVPGVANLNGHYGLNSTWHLLSALSNLDFIPQWRVVMALNGLVACVLGWYAASRLNRILCGSVLVTDWVVSFMPFFIFRNLLSSPSTDIPAIICTWFIFSTWLECIEKQEDILKIWPMLTVLPFWVVMLKSSSAPLLLVPFGLLLMSFRQANWPRFFGILAIGCIALIPWVLQNWFLTGYAVFPIKVTAIGNPIWQVPLQSIDKKFYLEQFGAFAPPLHYNWSWFKVWIMAQNPDTRIILALALVALLAGTAWLIARWKESSFNLVHLFGTVVCSLLAWLLTITEPRYGFGALVFAALLPIAFLFKVLSDFRPAARFLGLVMLPLTLFGFFRSIKEFEFRPELLVRPEHRPKVEYRSLECVNFKAATPVAYQSEVPVGKPVFCWDCPFPCFPKEAIVDSGFVKQIQVGWYRGFIYTQPSQ